MAILIGIVIAAVILGIAGFLVYREAIRMELAPPPPVFSMDEAYAWVVERLPDEVAATLTPEDVRRILALQIAYMKRKGVAVNGTTPEPRGPVIVGSAEAVEYIITEARAAGEEYLPEQVHPVVEIQLAYIRAIGAIGGRAAQPDQ